MDPLSFVIISLFSVTSIASGFIGAIGSVLIYKNPHQRSVLDRKAFRLVLALAMGLLLGMAELVITMLLSFGSYPMTIIAIEFLTTVLLVTGGTYLGYTLGIAVAKQR